MKKLLLVVVLAIVLVGLLAPPALAAKTVQIFHPQANVPILFGFGDGSWFEITGAGTIEWHWASFVGGGSLPRSGSRPRGQQIAM